MSPPVTEEGARGPRRRERANQKRMDLRGSDWRKKRERKKRRREREKEMKREGLWRSRVCSSELGGGRDRDWKRNLGLLSSSKNSILETERERS